MPHNDKHYQKLLRTHKFVVKMVLAVLFVLGVGLSLMWLIDRLGGSFMSRGWQVFFIIVFAFLVAGLQIPGYIMDIRKIDMDNPSPAQPQKPKPYAANEDCFQIQAMCILLDSITGFRSQYRPKVIPLPRGICPACGRPHP